MKEPRAIKDAVYMLAKGIPENRLKKLFDTESFEEWRLLFLSSGEPSIVEHMTISSKRTFSGQDPCILEVPIDAGKDMGGIEELHGFSTSGKLVNAIRSAAMESYGAVGIVWLQWIAKHIDELPEKIAEEMHRWKERHIPKKVPGPILPATERFALVAAAGELATSAGITGWDKGEAFSAVGKCYESWLNAQGRKFLNPRKHLINSVRH